MTRFKDSSLNLEGMSSHWWWRTDESNHRRFRISKKHLVKLNTLEIGYDEICDLEFMRHNTSIERLVVTGCRKVESLEPLTNNTTLVSLRMYRCSIRSLEPLRHNTTIRELDLCSNWIEDISPLAGNCTLTTVCLGNNPIKDVSPIETMTSVRWLSVGGCKVEDIRPVLRNRSIELLDASRNMIECIDSVRFNNTIEELFLSYNRLTKAKRMAILHNTSIENIQFDQMCEGVDEDLESDEMFSLHTSLNGCNKYERLCTLRCIALVSLEYHHPISDTYVY